jgi:tRNA 2-thiouridine synthesizing protein B
MILHTLNVSPSHPAFRDCLKIVQKEDALLLMGDGVYAALNGTEAWRALQDKGLTVYILSNDALTAGVCESSDIVRIDMDGFVTLTETYPRQLAWY